MNAQPKPRVGRYDLVTPMMPCREEILAKFEKFLDSGQYILGEEVRLLEEELASEGGCAEAVGVASGSSALFVALTVAGVRPGDEVITTPYTFDATVEAIVLLGAVPVLVDIKPTDLNIDPQKIEAAITDKTRCILPVHIFGAPADMHAIEEIAQATRHRSRGRYGAGLGHAVRRQAGHGLRSHEHAQLLSDQEPAGHRRRRHGILPRQERRRVDPQGEGPSGRAHERPPVHRLEQSPRRGAGHGDPGAQRALRRGAAGPRPGRVDLQRLHPGRQPAADAQRRPGHEGHAPPVLGAFTAARRVAPSAWMSRASTPACTTIRR